MAGAALVCAGPGLGVIDVRFAPFAQLALALCGAAVLGQAVAQLALADLAALGIVLLAALHADTPSRVVRAWIDWNYSGLEAKELWPAWSALCQRIRGDVSDPRVSVEYDPVHERAGSLRMYEMLFFFSGRTTLEGVYNQASTTTHPVYYLASELFARSPNPFRSRRYSQFDPENALRGCGCSTWDDRRDEPRAQGRARRPSRRRARGRDPALHGLPAGDPGPGYVEPLAFEPVRAPRSRLARPELPLVHAQAAEPRAARVHRRPALHAGQPTPGRPRPSGRCRRRARAETIEAESIRIETDRPGHPLLVKISYHPRWRAEGADGPYLVSPGLMLIVPRQREVRLAYAARTGSDDAGLGLAVLAVGLAAAWTRRSRPRRGEAVVRRGATSGREPVGVASVRAAPRARRWGWPRCVSFPSPRTPTRSTRSTLGHPGHSRRSGGRTPPSTPATRSRCFRPPTRGGTGCSAFAARRCFVPVMRGKRSSRSSSSSGTSRGAPAAGAALGRPRPRGGGRPGGGVGLATPAPRGVPRHALGTAPRAAGRPSRARDGAHRRRAASISRTIASAAAAGSAASVIGRPTTR